MHRFIYSPVIALHILILLFGSIQAAHADNLPEIPEKALPRFHKVNETLYRGGMPKEDGFRFLKKMGIKTIVNFRNGNDEQPLVESLGMKLVHIPLTASRGIPDFYVQEFFKVVNNSDNYPVFVHCRRGADRTGTMIAFYRIAFEGWDPEKAYREARDIGLHWWYFKLRKQIRSFNPEPFSELIPPN